MSLDSFLDRPEPVYWPKRKHLEELFEPEALISSIASILARTKRCLLWGSSGSGKSTVAIAFARWWETSNRIEVNRDRPNAFYCDAKPGDDQATGRAWFHEMSALDRDGTLFVVDNAHLAPTAASALALLIRRTPLRNVTVIFISAPKSSQSPFVPLLEGEDYWDCFEETGSVVRIMPEELFPGIARKYSEVYLRRESEKKFVTVEEDLRDPSLSERLAKTCSRNLIVARAILDEWSDLGGRLSDVPTERALAALARRYLKAGAGPALIPLAVLAQFEIRAAAPFVEGALPTNAVAQLEPGLLTIEDSDLYGKCYRLNLHAQTAALIAQAPLRERHGTSFTDRIPEENFNWLKTYLLSQPNNAVEVYRRLHQRGELEVGQRLLLDEQTREVTCAGLDHRPIPEAIFYSWVMRKVDPRAAAEFLERLVAETSVETLQSQVSSLGFKQFYWTSYFATRVNLKVARVLFGGLEAEVVAARISQEPHLSLVAQWINASPTSTAVLLGYDVDWRRHVAQMLDFEKLTWAVQESGLQLVYWALRALTGVSEEMGRDLIDALGSESLAEKFPGQPASVIHGFLKCLGRLGYGPDFIKSILEQVDSETLAESLRTARMQDIYWLLRDVANVSSDMARDLIDVLGPELIAEWIRDQPASVVQSMLEVLDKLQYGPDAFDTVFKLVGSPTLIQIVRKAKMLDLYWLLRRFRRTSHRLWQEILTSYPPVELAEKLRVANAAQLTDVLRVTPFEYADELVRILGPNSMEAIFARSRLKDIGWLLRRNAYRAKIDREIFFRTSLPARMVTEHLQDIGNFTWVLGQAPRGQELAARALSILVRTRDIATEARLGSLENVARLLSTAHRVGDDRCAAILLGPLQGGRVLVEALEGATVAAIEAVIRAASSACPWLVPEIDRALATIELQEAILSANLVDIAWLLWSALAHLDHSVAKRIARTVDATLVPSQLVAGNPNDLGRLLWHLIIVDDTYIPLRTLRQEALVLRLQQEWKRDPGPWTAIIGANFLADRPGPIVEAVSTLKGTQRTSLVLREWIENQIDGKHPYLLAQTVVGLELLHTAGVVVRDEVLREANITRRARELMHAVTSSVAVERSHILLQDALEIIGPDTSSS